MRAFRNASRMCAGPRRCRMYRSTASSCHAAIRNSQARREDEGCPSSCRPCNCTVTAGPDRPGRGSELGRNGSRPRGFQALLRSFTLKAPEDDASSSRLRPHRIARGGYRQVDVRKVLRYPVAKLEAPPHRLEVIDGAKRRPGEEPLARPCAVIFWPLLEPLLVHSVGFRGEDDLAA